MVRVKSWAPSFIAHFCIFGTLLTDYLSSLHVTLKTVGGGKLEIEHISYDVLHYL